MGLNGRGKVMALIKYLGITLDELRKNAGIPKIVFDSILLEKSDIPLRSKLKIMKLYPEISNVWLEYGGDYMTDGLKPNVKLLNLLHKLTNTTNLTDLMNSKLINYLARNPNMTLNHFKLILSMKCQLSYKNARYLSKELNINPYRLLALNDEELRCIKGGMESLVRKLSAYQMKSRIYNDESRLNNRKIVTESEAGPIYFYLKGKVDPMYLDHSKLNELLNKSDCRNLLTRYKTISESMADLMCKKLGLDYDDLVKNNLIKVQKNLYNSDFYNLIKDELPSDEIELMYISSKIGISHTSFKKHLKGQVMPGPNAAFKYYLYFDKDFSSLTTNKITYIKLINEHKKTVEKTCKP